MTKRAKWKCTKWKVRNEKVRNEKEPMTKTWKREQKRRIENNHILSFALFCRSSFLFLPFFVHFRYRYLVIKCPRAKFRLCSMRGEQEMSGKNNLLLRIYRIFVDLLESTWNNLKFHGFTGNHQKLHRFTAIRELNEFWWFHDLEGLERQTLVPLSELLDPIFFHKLKCMVSSPH